MSANLIRNHTNNRNARLTVRSIKRYQTGGTNSQGDQINILSNARQTPMEQGGVEYGGPKNIRSCIKPKFLLLIRCQAHEYSQT